MTDAPAPAWDGVPPESKRKQKHVVWTKDTALYQYGPQLWTWHPEPNEVGRDLWILDAESTLNSLSAAEMADYADYVGICLTPAEFEARVREAELQGFERATQMACDFDANECAGVVQRDLCAALARRRAGTS